jgi:hypothetical protein
MKLLFVAVSALGVFCVGCLLDSVEPWLSPETIVETEADRAFSVRFHPTSA